MSDILFSIFGFILAIGILVTVHEFGHYWVARRVGVKVLRFSVGFGRPIWMRRAGPDQTEYVIGALPLGGYVKMLDESEGEVAEDELHRAFNRQSLAKRAAVVLAGPGFNFLFAILAYWAVFALGVDGIKPIIGEVRSGSLAEQSGFKAGQEIIGIDGRDNRSWSEHRLHLFNEAFAGRQIPVLVRESSGEERNLSLDLGRVPVGEIDAGLLEKAIGLIPYRPKLEPIIGSVQLGSPAAAAGLQAGDRILSLDQTNIDTWQDLVKAVRAQPGQLLKIRVQRGEAVLELSVAPQGVEQDGKRIGRLGVVVEIPTIPPQLRVTVSYGPLEAMVRGIETTWVMTALTVRMLVKMVKLEVSSKNISGPITIAQYAGESVQIGIDRFLLFLAVVSISLGILNLLPIPMLDGGHLLYYIIETVIRRPVPKQAMIWGQQIGILALIGLMSLAFYNDIVRLLQ